MNQQPNKPLTADPTQAPKPLRDLQEASPSEGKGLEKTPAFVKKRSEDQKSQKTDSAKKPPAVTETTLKKAERLIEQNDYFLDDDEPFGEDSIKDIQENENQEPDSQDQIPSGAVFRSTGNFPPIHHFNDHHDRESLMNQSIGGLTRVGDIYNDVRSNYGAGIEKTNQKDGSDSKKQRKENRDEVANSALKTLPKPVLITGATLQNSVEVQQLDVPEEELSFEMPHSKKRCCRRTGDDIEDHIDINLDSCGKHCLVLGFSLLQLCSVLVTCLQFYQFYLRECSPVAYKPMQPFGLQIDMVLMASTGAAIFLKFVSIVCLSLALDEYQNLGSNTSYLFTALLATTAPACLVAPVYTFDHAQCVPANFVVPQSVAEQLSLLSMCLILVPLGLMMLSPASYSSVFSNSKENRDQEQSEQSFAAKMSRAIMLFTYFYIGAVSLVFFLGGILVLVPKYDLGNGEFFMGASNELFSAVFIAVIFASYHQSEITEEEVKFKKNLFDQEVERRKSEASSRHQMSLNTLVNSEIKKGSVGSPKSNLQPQNVNLSGSLDEAQVSSPFRFQSESSPAKPNPRQRSQTVSKPLSSVLPE